MPAVLQCVDVVGCGWNLSQKQVPSRQLPRFDAISTCPDCGKDVKRTNTRRKGLKVAVVSIGNWEIRRLNGTTGFGLQRGEG